MTTKRAVVKLKLLKPPTAGVENCQNLQQKWKMEAATNELIQNFLRWYNKKIVVLTLEVMKKRLLFTFYRDKDIDVLKLAFTLPNLANTCLHISTHKKIYRFTKADKDLLEKSREDAVGGPSIVFTRKAVVDEFLMPKSTNLRILIVWIDACQIYPSSMCQPMPTKLYTRWDLVPETSRFTPPQNNAPSSENMVLSYFQRPTPDFKIDSFYTTGR